MLLMVPAVDHVADSAAVDYIGDMLVIILAVDYVADSAGC